MGKHEGCTGGYEGSMKGTWGHGGGMGVHRQCMGAMSEHDTGMGWQSYPHRCPK